MASTANGVVRSPSFEGFANQNQPPTPPTPDPTNEIDAQEIDLNDALAQAPNDMKTQQPPVDERMKCICKCIIL